MALDVTSQSQCRAVISKVREKYGRLDILCSNTGIFPQCTIKSMTEQDWDTMQKVNVKGMFFLVQAALGVMEEQKYGRIVITSSITGPVTGLEPLRCKQSRTAWFYAQCRAGICPSRDHH